MATDTLVWKRLLLLSLLLYWPQVYVDVEVPKQDYVIHSNINLLFIDLHVLVLKKGGRKKKSTQGKAFCLQQAKNYVSDREHMYSTKLQGINSECKWFDESGYFAQLLTVCT